ncbi:MAG: FixH family protein [Polyangiaceae bacterium]|nr:FixH family protein [Polyangiaceae bacterium]
MVVSSRKRIILGLAPHKMSLIGGIAWLVCAISACSGSPSAPGVTDCQADPNLFDFSGRMVAASEQGTFQLRMLELAPEVPTKGDNRWTIELLDTQQAPLENPEIQVTPFMPQHGHGTGVKAVVAKGEVLGTWIVSPVNLWMPGLWEVKLTVSHRGQIDNLVIRACIEG